MSVKTIHGLVDDEQYSFIVEAAQSALEEAKEVLKRHETEDPPMADTQLLSEAMEDYSNIVTTARRRVSALKAWRDILMEVK